MQHQALQGDCGQAGQRQQHDQRQNALQASRRAMIEPLFQP